MYKEIREIALMGFKLTPEQKAEELMTIAGKYAHANLLSYRKESHTINCAKIAIMICDEVIDNTADDRYNDIDFSVHSNIYYWEVKRVLKKIIKEIY